MNATDKPVRLLILEDNEIDKRIIHAVIEKSGLNFTTIIVDNKRDYEKALKSFNPDVVLSDYVLPDIDGLEALELHKKLLSAVPFIFVTGQLSEETAIECLNLGAWDYIMKDQIKRLPVSINHALALKNERETNRRNQQLILENEKRYKTLSELTYEGIAIHKKGIIVDCNLSFCNMFGYDYDELINKFAADFLIHPDFRRQTLQNALKGLAEPYETLAVKKDGTVFPVEQEGKNFIYNNEEVRVVAVRDITNRKKALEELKLSEEKFNKISSAAKDAIILIDHDGNVSFWNKAAEDLLQYASGEIIGKNLHMTVAPEKYLAEYKRGFAKFLESGEGNAIGKTLDLEARRKDGEIIPVELSLSSINIRGNWNAVGILRDISERKKVETELRNARQHARDMNQMKTNFLSTMSHELRTPLNGIQGFSEILCEILEDQELREYAETIFKSSERILNTFNLIIDLAVLDANKVMVNKKQVDLVYIIKSACESYASQAAEKNLYLNQKLVPQEAIAEIDQTILTQALNNLLNNAVKYTDKGGITVSLSQVVRDGIDCFVVSVEDTGIGIPEEKASVIYQAFRQGSEGYNRPYEGMGLGLYITKRYVDLLEGVITMKSEPGAGTRFTIYIPKNVDKELSPSLQPEQEPGVSEIIDNKSVPCILYVEDDANHQEFVRYFLKEKYELHIADTGEDALEMIKNGPHFDLVLMDINLGAGINGLEAVARIREMPEYNTVPIAAVTANALVSQKNAYLANGCTDYITKPFRKSTLLAFIDRMLQHEPA